MKRIKILSLALAALLLAALLAGCSGTAAPAATPADTTVSVTDMKDREIKLDAPATKVVALTASDCEILFAIGAGGTLVGRGEFCDYPEDVTSVPSVQSGNLTNVEEIIALEPQVVIMGVMAQTIEQTEALETAGIKVVVSDAQDIAGVYTAIELIGKVVGYNVEAASLIDDMKHSFAATAAKITADSGKTVYFEVSPLEWGLWTAGTGTFMDEIAAMLGLTNAFADTEGWSAISQEQVIERDPDYIVTTAMYFGVGLEPVDEIMARSGWQELKAVKGETVFSVNSDEFTRPGPRLVSAVDALYAMIYGD